MAFRVPLCVITVIAIVVIMLYGPTRDYYVAMRSGQDMERRIAALGEVRSDILSELDRLQTREGIEDEARSRGYVMEGEVAVKVQGIGDDTSTKVEDSVHVDYSVPWHVSALDFIFGYTPGEYR